MKSVDADLVCRSAVLSADNRTEPGFQFIKLKRFGKVIVGTRVQPFYSLSPVGACGQNKDGLFFPVFFSIFALKTVHFHRAVRYRE